MSIRIHPLTGEPILFAPGRASRPRAFYDDTTTARCAFCPGHESDTPPALAQAGDPWRVRVFPNKYPPIEGAEVIVESPRHEDTFDEIAHAPEVLAMYVARYRAHPEAAYVSVFKNEGARAGASIPHLHSQVIPVPFLPPRIAREAHGFGLARPCPMCDPRGHVIAANASFIWLAPEASALAYQQWIVPRRHVGDFSGLSDNELEDLAALLRVASRATRLVAPAFNWAFINFPQQSAAHWYLDILPRLVTIAGFELGTGTFVEIIDPAAAAKRLRET
jgi:UDPglucose--hexose-1-phosphate uridylyltransferase